MIFKEKKYKKRLEDDKDILEYRFKKFSEINITIPMIINLSIFIVINLAVYYLLFLIFFIFTGCNATTNEVINIFKNIINDKIWIICLIYLANTFIFALLFYFIFNFHKLSKYKI